MFTLSLCLGYGTPNNIRRFKFEQTHVLVPLQLRITCVPAVQQQHTPVKFEKANVLMPACLRLICISAVYLSSWISSGAAHKPSSIIPSRFVALHGRSREYARRSTPPEKFNGFSKSHKGYRTPPSRCLTKHKMCSCRHGGLYNAEALPSPLRPSRDRRLWDLDGAHLQQRQSALLRFGRSHHGSRGAGVL